MQVVAPLPKHRIRWTDRQLLALPRNGYKHETLDGTLLMSPGAANHGWVSLRLASLLLAHAERYQLGKVFDSSTGFRLSPSTLLSPDVSFLSNARLPEVLVAPDKFLQGAPNLAVEVLSPSDRLKVLESKLAKYFAHGTQLAWLVNMKKQEVVMRTADSERKLIGLNAVLTGGTVLPKFKCRLGDIFGRV